MDAKTGEMGCPMDRPTTVRSLLGPHEPRLVA